MLTNLTCLYEVFASAHPVLNAVAIASTQAADGWGQVLAACKQ